MAMQAASPRVFISYSHDSDQHKAWVRQLGSDLRSSGVDVVLDQWDLELGDDPTHFMEQAVSRADRVLLVITKKYISRSNTPRGGVGYERAVITQSIARRLTTKKFIPIVREKIQTLPAFLGSKIYADFQDDSKYLDTLESLIRSILQKPKFIKPPIGLSPFSENSKSDPQAKIRIDPMKNNKPPSDFHWSAPAHRFFGNELHFIFLKLRQSSDLNDETIPVAIKRAGIKDFTIYPLFSEWDLLIRVWCRGPELTNLLSFVDGSGRLSDSRPLEKLVVTEIRHWPNETTLPEDIAVQSFLRNTPLTHFEDLDKKRINSEHFDKFDSAGAIISNDSRFKAGTIQFFMLIRSTQTLNDGFRLSLRELIQSEDILQNKSLFFVSGYLAHAVIKAQCVNYYDVGDFHKRVLARFKANIIWTETMLVAYNIPDNSSEVDWGEVVRFRTDTDFADLFPLAKSLPYLDQIKCLGMYVSCRELAWMDREEILIKIVRAVTEKSPVSLGNAVGFITRLESSLRKTLPKILSKNEISNEEFLKSLGISNSIGRLVLGDLQKSFCRLAEMRLIFRDESLSSEDFSSAFQKIIPIRNAVAHGSDISFEDNSVFESIRDFLPFYYALARLCARGE